MLIDHTSNTAESIRDTTWKPKFKVEEEKQKAEEQSAVSDGLKGIQVIFLLMKVLVKNSSFH